MKWRETPAAQAFWVLLGVVVLWAALAAPVHAAFPGKNGKIAYVRHGCPDSGGCQGEQIWTMNPDGSDQTFITAPGTEPAWSPDGSKIAFAAKRDTTHIVGYYDIFVMNADGSDVRQLTNDAAFDFSPNWSPDGTKIVFESNRDADLYSAQYDVYVMNADGSDVKNLTRNPAFDGEPAWSPDGGRIAFISSRDPRLSTGLFLMDPDGTNVTLVTETGYANSHSPDWSPDGSKLVYTSGGYQISVVARDGTGNTLLSREDPSGFHHIESGPAWSPDGSRIVFMRFEGLGLDDEIFSIDPAGGDLTNLTSTSSDIDDYFPDWQPIPGPRRSDFKNAAKFCKAEREFLGESAFAQKYGTNGNGANAFGKCVSVSSG